MSWWAWALLALYITGLLVVLLGSTRRSSGTVIDAIIWPLYLIGCLCE